MSRMRLRESLIGVLTKPTGGSDGLSVSQEAKLKCRWPDCLRSFVLAKIGFSGDIDWIGIASPSVFTWLVLLINCFRSLRCTVILRGGSEVNFSAT